ncbi:hypothetical protein [Streptomyces termitum]|uniref:hypothetical protein n=1 Tax=Streptomyces termitum TaxID=67368 RepID=UPI0037B25231
MRTRPRQRAFLAVTTAALALGLTACGGGGTTAGGPADRSTGPAAGTPATPGTPEAEAPETAGAPEATEAAASGTSQTSGKRKPVGPRGGVNDTEAYAYAHPCAMTQLSLEVRPSGTLRIIEVTNMTADACLLDPLPAVDLGDQNNSGQDRNIHPLIPGGVGGPGHVLRAGTTAYAVLDINPARRTGGTEEDVNEMNVLLSPSQMPNADTRVFRLGPAAGVFAPRLGLYRATVAEATASARQADTPSPR